jgi:bifunctional DNase/RNase
MLNSVVGKVTKTSNWFMKKIELDIVAISHSVTQTSNYAVVLGEKRGSRRLPIVIGSFEAQAIAVAMERMTPNRPLTHDLFKNALETYDIQLKEVIINNLLDGIFYSKLVCSREGVLTEIDSRTSDALAMAVRFNCPIFTFEFILDAAGVVLEDSEIEEDTEPAYAEAGTSGNPLVGFTTEALTKLLDEVLEEENYERAAQIRDELDRRKAYED